MNTFRDRYKQHPLHQSIANLNQALAGVELPKRTETGDDPAILRLRRESYARFLRVVTLVLECVAKSDPVIWTPSALNVADSAVSQLKLGLDQFLSTFDTNYLLNHADTAIEQIRPLLSHKESPSAESTPCLLAAFHDIAEHSARSLEEIDKAISEKEDEISQARDEFRGHLDELKNQLESFKSQFESQKSRIDDLVTSQQQAFQSSQTERANLSSQEHDNRKQSFRDWTKSAEIKLEAILKSTKVSADDHLAEMDKHKARAKEILGIVAASGVAGHYKNTATRELVSAEILRVLALLCFGVMAYVIYHVVESLNTPTFRWEMGVFRVGVGLALLVPAYYCAKESTKHREAEKRNRRLQIELATIEPYLEKLNDDPAMREILKKKADSYFMGQMHAEPNDDVEGAMAAKEIRRRESQVMELLKGLVSLKK